MAGTSVSIVCTCAGANLIMDKMKVPAPQRKKMWGTLVKKSTNILDRMFVLATRSPRNYILDQVRVWSL